MLRTALLGGNSITLDADMSKYIETLSEQGVIEGLEVSSGSVAPGKAWVKATRSNGETIMVLVQNTQAQSISLNGDVFVGIEIDQNAINNGALNNEDGTGIASIKVSPSKPSQNYLVLAVNQGGRLTDQRAMIPKIQSVAQRTSSLEQKMKTQEQKVERLEEAGTPSYLGVTSYVGEKYELGDELVLDEMPEEASFTESTNLGDVNERMNIEIPFIHNGGSLSYFDILASKVGDPSYGLDCHFYEAEVIKTGNIYHYRRKGGIIQGSSVASIGSNKGLVRITPSAPFNKPKGTLMVAVVFPNGNRISSVNYFKIYLNPEVRSEQLSPAYKAQNGAYQTVERKAIYYKSDGNLIQTFGKSEYRDELYSLDSVGGSGSYGARTGIGVSNGHHYNNLSARLSGKVYIKGSLHTNMISGRNTSAFTIFLTPGYNSGDRIELGHFDATDGRSTKELKIDLVTDISRAQNYHLVFVPDGGGGGEYSHDVHIKIGNITRKKNHGTTFMPTEQKNPGEKVEGAFEGILNGKQIKKNAPMITVNKTISGNATGEWTAPSNGLLVYRLSYYNGGGKATGYINGIELTELGLRVSDGNQFGIVSVQAGAVQIKTTSYSSYNGLLTIAYFIPL